MFELGIPIPDSQSPRGYFCGSVLFAANWQLVETSGYWFFNSWSIFEKILRIHIQSLSENFWSL